MTRRSSVAPAALGVLLLVGSPADGNPPTRDEALRALKKAVGFYRGTVARHGGYLWHYSSDLKLAEGEGKVADAHTVWVQPPGTPSVGLAYLTAYEATGDKEYLDAAREAAAALVAGQLRSGGWTYRIEFDPAARKQFYYRSGGHPKGRNVTSLDDNTTQDAVRLLVRVDQAHGFRDKVIHEAVEYALDALVKAQYPNGAWPQGFDRPPAPADFPVKKAGYPDTWPQASVRKDYWTYYTLNDGCSLDALDMMALAADVYDEPRYKAAVKRAGGFLLLAQMPDPQPAWAQQYNPDMHPAWARKFEPPAVTGGESQRVLETLLWLYRRTKDEKYLEPIPRALAYLKASRLPDGRLARFYELKTNKPLYFTRAYELTHAADDLPTHYGFIVSSRLDAIAAEYERVKAGKTDAATRKPDVGKLGAKARDVIDGLDARGAWVEKGRLRFHAVEPASGVISSRTFIENVTTLSRFAAASR